MYFRFSVFCVLLVLATNVLAQDFFQEDPVKLKEVRVTSQRLHDYGVGATVSRPDSTLVKLHRSGSLSSLLSNTSGVSLKTYGPGGLASLSIRGGSSSHTAVLWNGLNIQSPMNGGVNLSVMPVHFFDNVEVQHGGSGTLFGSGAVSGVIHLSGDDLLRKENSLEASLSKGSFGLGSAGASIKTGSSRFASRLSIFGQKADNDFPYTNTSRIGHPEETQTNAGVTQYGVLQENQWRISDKSLLTTGFWYQDYDKDLQTLMTSRRPDETNQRDENFMASVNYKYYGQKSTLNVKQGLIRNKVLYSDPDMADPQADNNSLSWINEAEYKYRLGKYHSVNVGVNYTYELARSDGYMGDIIRNRMAAFASGRYGLSSGRGAVVLSFREEMSDADIQPVVFSLGVEHPLWNSIQLKGNISKNYRIPNLNDLYWKEDGYAKGNPDLIAESGWSGDVGVDFLFNRGIFATRLSAAYFASRTEDIIVWLPQDGSKWMPQNKKIGETDGIEVGVELTGTTEKSRISARVFYTYVNSMLFSDDEYNDRQMVYTPENNVNALVGYSRGAFYATLSGRFTDERYYDHSNTLDAYSIWDTSLGYKFRFSGVRADCSFKINNITNTDYQVVAWYAMPLRNYLFSIDLTI
ncbi:TonB-dependent receptor [Marinilabilia salmonicolor]|uniref:TonB-dependent receptor n=1 Tax=Marinilabilia salmonicolor TaxID=989 RepID=UPI00029AFF1D|nr:TonB-dependent receptor [Marinilabilia salmonicolor]